MDREEKILLEYHNTVGTDSLKARNLIKQLDYKENHRYLQFIAQTYLDESRFEDDGTMRIYLNKRKWRMAERYIIKAHIINPDCADVLSVMGEVRKLNGQTDIAIYCFEKIIKLGIKGIAHSGCKLNPESAKELINDSKFELYRIYHDMNPKLSKRYLSMYKKGLEKGAHTIFKPLKKFLLD
jgi:tetratricopeptide (TPR) repeat protein